jgi:hypothetical protein
MCLKDWFDTKDIDHNHSNLYDISEYDTLILFNFYQDHSNFSYIFLQFCLKFIEFVRAISVDTC